MWQHDVLRYRMLRPSRVPAPIRHLRLQLASRLSVQGPVRLSRRQVPFHSSAPGLSRLQMRPVPVPIRHRPQRVGMDARLPGAMEVEKKE